MHFAIFSHGEVCLFMKTERKYIVNSFEKFKNKVSEWNIWYGIILQMSPNSSLVAVWAAHSQDREQGRREKRDCKAIHEQNFVVSHWGSLGTKWSCRKEGGEGLLSQEAWAQGASTQSPTPWGGRASRAQPSPLPAHTEPFERSARAAGPLCNLFWMCHAQSFKRTVNPSQWSSYKTGSPFPIPRIKKKSKSHCLDFPWAQQSSGMQGTALQASWTEKDSGDPALATALTNETYGHPMPAESGLHVSSPCCCEHRSHPTSSCYRKHQEMP